MNDFTGWFRFLYLINSFRELKYFTGTTNRMFSSIRYSYFKSNSIFGVILMYSVAGIKRSLYFTMALSVSAIASSSTSASVRGFAVDTPNFTGNTQITKLFRGSTIAGSPERKQQSTCYSMIDTGFFGDGTIGRVCDKVILNTTERGSMAFLKRHQKAVRLASLPVPTPLPQVNVAALPKQNFGGVVLGHSALPIGNAEHDRNWRNVSKRAMGDMDLLKTCLSDQKKCDSNAIQKWSNIVIDAKRKLGIARIAYVNRAMNRAARYRTDLVNFGLPDYWTSPSELLSGNGDCEDFALGKYYTLRALGVPASDMRLVIMKNTRNRKDHAVLVVSHGNTTVVLDNLSDVLKGEEQLRYYRPVYSLNEERKWAFLPKSRLSKSKLASRSSKRFSLKMAHSKPALTGWKTTISIN